MLTALPRKGKSNSGGFCTSGGKVVVWHGKRSECRSTQLANFG